MDLSKYNQTKIKTLVKIAVDNKLDYLRVGDLEIKKSIHFKEEDIKNLQNSAKETTDEEDLYWSSTPNVKTKV